MRALVSYGLALLIIAVGAVWLGTGTFVQGGRGPGNGERPIVSLIEGEDGGPLTEALHNSGLLVENHAHIESAAMTIAERQAEVNGEAAPAVSVRTMTATARPFAIQVPLRGNTKASSTVSAVAETAGIVETVHVTKGQTVAIGDTLCTLDQGTRNAAVSQAEAGLAQAQASLAQAQADFDTNAELRSKGLAPANTARGLEVALTAAQAGVTAAQSGLDNANAELDRTVITAEASGIIQDPLVSAGSLLGMGQPCATIVQLDPIKFVGMVPEARIGLAKLGLKARITTVAGDTAEGDMSYIASTADPATRSFAVEISVPNPDRRILDGLSATATVTMGTAPAHLLPQSVLTLDDAGTLGVRTVESEHVAFYPVTIISDTREGIWVTGLPLVAEVITVGQEFVQPGQKVIAGHAPGATTPVTPATPATTLPHAEGV